MRKAAPRHKLSSVGFPYTAGNDGSYYKMLLRFGILGRSICLSVLLLLAACAQTELFTHVAKTVQRIKHHSSELRVETLVGDFRGNHEDVRTVVRDGSPDVFAHNVEVVPRLQRTIRDARCSWDRSVGVLAAAKELGSSITKSSLMVGLGEERDEVLEAMQLLRDADVDVLTVGQYLRPTKRHAAVARYVEPAEFADYERAGVDMGFRFVASGPLVRSSYRAAEVFLTGELAEEANAGEAPRMDRYGKKKLAVLT